MSAHLSEQEVEGYRQRTLSPAALLSVDDHIAICETCRQRLLETSPLKPAFSSLQAALHLEAERETDHLSYEQLAAYVDEELEEVDREIVESHLEFCSLCAAEARDLQEFKEKLELHPVPEYTPEPPPTLGEKIGVLSRPGPDDSTLLQALHQSPGSFTGMAETVRMLIRRKVPGGQPVLLAPRSTPAFAVRGTVEGESDLLILSPQPGEVLLIPQVDLRWTAGAGAQGYQVRIYRERHKEQPWQERKVLHTRTILPVAYGKEYSVQIGAIGKSTWTPEIPFRVLDRQEAETLQNSHLLRGIFYEQQGLLSQALTEYQALQETHPDSPVVREILQQLKRQLEGTE